jgi:hypothetical protein
MTVDRLVLEESLASHRVKIEFTKVNGESRIMLSTRDPGLIPADHLPKGADARPDPRLLKVYDLEKAGWRSMRFDSIQSWVLAD